MKRSSWTVCVATLTVMVLAATLTINNAVAADPPAGSSSGVEVKIDNFNFTPATITVKAGTQITFVNGDDIPHTVVSDDHSFKSKVLDTDEKFTFTPTKPGTYTYFCSI